MYSINVKRGDDSTSRSTMAGIEVTTEMIQETTSGHAGESTSQRRLVLDSQ